MAELVFGLASSHSPQLSTPADGWAGRGERDKGHLELIGTDGITSNYEDLLARTDTERIAKEITPEKFEQRHQRNQKAIAHLSKKLYDANLDVLVMVGDDQHEYLLDDNMPAFCVYWGDEVKVTGHEAGPSTGGRHLIGYNTEDQQVPTDSPLGLHIINSLMDAEFDVGSSRFLDPTRGRGEQGGIGHAFGYVYNRLMTDGHHTHRPRHAQHLLPAPTSPRPSGATTWGRLCAPPSSPGTRTSASASWPPGGLSHFVVDEELDQQALAGNASQERGSADGVAARKDQLRQLRNPQLDRRNRRHRAPGHGRGGLRALLSLAGRHGLRHGVRHLGLG